MASYSYFLNSEFKKMPKHKESVNRACHYSSKLIVKFFSAEGKNELELFVPQQQKTAIQADSGVLIVFLVAGAGFIQDPTISAWV